MKILIVDNGTSYLNKLQNLLVDRDFEIVKFSELDLDFAKDFDVVVLSGGHNFPVLGNEHLLQNEINFIKNCNKPIFGICFGFELIANVFNAELNLMENKEKGIVDIEVIEQDKIFSDIPNFKVFESHRWVVKDVGENLDALAKSKDGIEVIKHKTLPIHAVQFHPEMFVEETCGDEIFNNFLKSINV